MAIMSKVFAVLALSAIGSYASPALPLLARQGPQACRNQSCAVATVAGSTGATVYDYPFYPSGDTQDGNCCIIRHFPAAKNAIYAARPGLQNYCAFTGGDAPIDANPPGVTDISVTSGTAAGAKRDTAATTPCKPNILIFAKGTFEPGDVGVSIGSTISQNLDTSRWQVVGINYDNGLNNNYCLGLPGGVTARATINQVFTTCPNSNIVLGGYSQGAMVIRNAIARIPAAQASKISSVLTFGDPFCGAKIGQYSGPINVFCNSGDGVCDGRLDISVDHLSYAGATTAGIALLRAGQK